MKFALERFLYRLGASRFAGQYVLKGALLFQVWEGGLPRMTRDLDLLGLGDNSEAAIRAAFGEILEAQVLEDGLRFDPGSLSVEPIAQQTSYVGMRVKCRAFLGKAMIPLQIDVGFGDEVSPRPEAITYPTLLDFPAPRVLAYAKETVVAEKTQAVIELGLLNSRLIGGHHPTGIGDFGPVAVVVVAVAQIPVLGQAPETVIGVGDGA
ncbi:MAG: nucleotidyl transferase AbiEii/AbiGii toxin family protein, partial [Thermoanaerobaculia bacterium]